MISYLKLRYVFSYISKTTSNYQQYRLVNNHSDSMLTNVNWQISPINQQYETVQYLLYIL